MAPRAEESAMPCSDVTEYIKIRLDGEDRLAVYELIKKTCGRAVGERSLVAEWLEGLPADDILAISADDFADAHPMPSIEEEFLLLKHLFALQCTLKAVLGQEPGGATDEVSIASIGYDEGELHADAFIAVDVITEKIEACGRCKGCAAFAKK